MGMPAGAAWARCARSAQLLALLAWVSSACSSGDDASPLNTRVLDAGGQAVADAGLEAVRAVFEPAGDPLRFGSMPWPDDLYRGDDGRVHVQGLGSGGNYATMLGDAMAGLDGFGVIPTAYFWFDAPLEEASLPADDEASVERGASVFLIDADTSSPDAFQRIPCRMRLREGGTQLVLWPAAGRVLTPGRRYAVVVTSDVRSEDGRPVEGSSQFVAIRDPETVLEGPLAMRARAQYTPVLETLASDGVRRDEVIALALFTVQTVGKDLADARELVGGEALAGVTPTAVIGDADLDAALGTPADGLVGVDAEGGVPHGGIGWMVHGTYSSPNLLSAAAGNRGSFERNESGELRVKRREDVHFSLLLPRAELDGTPLPVVIVQHGFGGERSQSLAVANALAASGYAVFAIDAPYHGLRAMGADTGNRFTGADVVDGFGDVEGDFAGLAAGDGPLGALHPFYYRDAVRQTAIDLMVLIRLIQEGDWGAVMAEMPELAELAFDGQALGFVGVDVGAEVGLSLVAQEAPIGALALGFPGGFTVSSWAGSPARAELFGAILERAGVDATSPDFALDDPVRLPQLSVWQALVDAADGAAHAANVRRRPVNVLAWVARDDEVVPNHATEALGQVLGATLVGDEPRHLSSLPGAMLAAGGTLSANFGIGEDMLTRVLFALSPATHEALFLQRGEARYGRPLEPPFEPLPQPREVENPLAETLMQLVFFFESWRACLAGDSDAVCAASVRAP